MARSVTTSTTVVEWHSGPRHQYGMPWYGTLASVVEAPTTWPQVSMAIHFTSPMAHGTLGLMAAQDPCKDVLTRHPVGSPERQAQVNACMEQGRKKRMKREVKQKMTTPTTKPITGNSGKSPVQSAIDTFKGDTWRTG